MTRAACAVLAAVALLSACDRATPAPAAAAAAARPAQALVADAVVADAVAPAAAAAAATPRAPPGAVLDRIGPLVVGEVFTPRPAAAPWVGSGKHLEVDCEHFTGGALPAGVSMMVMDGRIARFELHRPDAGVRAPFGLHPGMTRAAVEAALPPGVQVSRHEYGDAGDVYLDWRPRDGAHGVRAEIFDGTADAVFWGDGQEIQAIEGCS